MPPANRAPAAPPPRRARIVPWLLACAVAATLLCFRLDQHDPLTDEEEIAFRAVGYMDYLATPYQTTPYEWFAEPPWWVGLSFHDHPPLLFAVEHALFRLCGDSLLVLRLPFALLGVASLLLLGALARDLYGEPAAWIAMALGAVNTYWLWVFRLGIQEGPVIFFLLASLCCLMRARRDPRWLVTWGIVAGLALLTKLTSVLVFAVGLAYVLAFQPSLLRTTALRWGLVATAVLFSPVLVYNVALVRAVGHPDLQLSSLLHLHTQEWGVLPRQSLGTLGGNVARFLPELGASATWLFVGLAGASMVAIGVSFARGGRRGADAFVLAAWALTAALVVVIGPSQRFLAMLTPFSLLLCAAALVRLPRAACAGALAVLLVAQAALSFRTLHAVVRTGTPGWTISALNVESGAYGYGALEAYLHELLDTARPAVTLDLPPALRFVASFRARHPRHAGGAPHARLVVYDPRMNNVAKLWLFDRRYYYDGWPILPVDDYLFARERYATLFADLGITEYYYVAAEDGLVTAGNTSTSPHAAEVRARLAGLRPERTFFAPDGRPTFTVYRLTDGP